MSNFIDLPSAKGIDYTRLRDLLEAKNWKEADKETYLAIIQSIGKKNGNSLTICEVSKLPMTDLRTIDQLWVKYSNGHFGFSVQKEIYLSIGGKIDPHYYIFQCDQASENFCELVGWKKNKKWISYSKVNFDTSSPRGHLPHVRLLIDFWSYGKYNFLFFGMVGLFAIVFEKEV